MALRNLASRARLVPPGQAEGPFGIVRPLAALGVDLDPFLMMDWARGSEDPFGPHPHAGFSAVTWLLPQSKGSVRNRDSLGDDSVFHPGEMHWFEAAHGAVHNESPVGPGPVELLQIFVNLPAAQKHEEPRTYRARKDAIPVHAVGPHRVHVVVGSFDGQRGPVQPRTPEVNLLHVEVSDAGDVPLVLSMPRGHSVAALVVNGAVRANGTAGDANAFAFADDGDSISLTGRGEVVVLHGRPLREPRAIAGPFVMSTRAEVMDAHARYQSGAVGHVEPLPEWLAQQRG